MERNYYEIINVFNGSIYNGVCHDCAHSGITYMTEKVLVSGLKTPDGTVLYSRHRHDYKTHDDSNGEWYMIDGGLSYHRGSVNVVRGEYISLTTESPHVEIREHFGWGTYGKDGKEPLHEMILKDMETGHIEAVLRTQARLGPHITKVFEDELEFRSVLTEMLLV